MNLRFSELTPRQSRALVSLDDGTHDFPGRSLFDIPHDTRIGVYELEALGLAEECEDGRGRVSFRLTEAGRRVRETGAA